MRRPGALGVSGLILSRAGRAHLARVSERQGGVHLGFCQDQAAADAVPLCARLLEQLFSLGVVLTGATHHGLRLPGRPLLME
jgi:hypothetical protein